MFNRLHEFEINSRKILIMFKNLKKYRESSKKITFRKMIFFIK